MSEEIMEEVQQPQSYKYCVSVKFKGTKKAYSFGTDNDELKYSLRSLEKYANWINKIYIITDNQVPEWLNTDNKKVKIIDHSEIIPKECLPVFNSNAIEHCIVNIPNLSEYYLYGNDDTFFANKVSPSYFYHKDGYPYCRFSYKFDKDFDFYNRMCTNTDYLIEKKFGKSLKMFCHHNINAYRKSDVKNCIEMFKKEINETVAEIRKFISRLLKCSEN